MKDQDEEKFMFMFYHYNKSFAIPKRPIFTLWATYEEARALDEDLNRKRKQLMRKEPDKFDFDSYITHERMRHYESLEAYQEEERLLVERELKEIASNRAFEQMVPKW